MSTSIPRQTSEENKDSIPRGIISVSGGVAEVVSKPLDVAVTLFDYDVDGVENVSKDPDGEKCIASHWDAKIEVRPQNPKSQNYEKGKMS